MCVGVRPRKCEAGFTIVEMIVALTIVVVMGGALYVCFSQGVRAWHTALRGIPGEAQAFFFEKMTSNMRNAFVYKEITLRGDKRSLEFYAPVLRKARGDLKTGLRVPTRFRYYFDSSKKAVCQDTESYEKILSQAKAKPKCENLIDNVADASFEYYQAPGEKKSGGWISTWNESCFPDAVKVVFAVLPDTGSRSVRIIRLPVKKLCQN